MGNQIGKYCIWLSFSKILRDSQIFSRPKNLGKDYPRKKDYPKDQKVAEKNEEILKDWEIYIIFEKSWFRYGYKWVKYLDHVKRTDK